MNNFCQSNVRKLWELLNTKNMMFDQNNSPNPKSIQLTMTQNRVRLQILLFEKLEPKKFGILLKHKIFIMCQLMNNVIFYKSI